jgi:hypothetical protein
MSGDIIGDDRGFPPAGHGSGAAGCGSPSKTIAHGPLRADRLYRIKAPYFCAGFTIGRDGSVTSVAPILRKRFTMTNMAYVRMICARNGWYLEHVP